MQKKKGQKIHKQLTKKLDKKNKMTEMEKKKSKISKINKKVLKMTKFTVLFVILGLYVLTLGLLKYIILNFFAKCPNVSKKLKSKFSNIESETNTSRVNNTLV